MTGRWTDTVRREVLANGLTVLVQPDPASPAVAVVTHVRAGFLDEPDHWAGISHVLEHMYFKGTARRGPGDIARETKAAGGYVNAGTSYDYTAYYAVLPAAALATALDIQSDALRHAAIDAGELGRELQVIIEEARRKRDAPGAVAQETLHAVLFDAHRIRRWRIGEEERLATFTRGDVLGYYRTRYVPSRTIVAIAGGVDPDRALALARDRFADWPDAPARLDPPVEEPWRHEVRARTLRGDVADAQLVLGWRAPPVLDADRPALEMAAAILSSGRAAWLNRGLRQSGIVTAVGAGLLANAEVGVFSIGAELAPGRIPEALRVTATLLDRLARQGPSADDLDRARTLLRARWARWLESAESRAMGLAHAEATDGYRWLDRAYDEAMEVDAERIRQAARRYLRADAVGAVAYLPRGAGDDLTAAVLRERFAVSRPSARAVRTGDIRQLALPGLDLLVRRKRGTPLVTLRLHRARQAPEPAERAGVGLLAVRSAVRGAGGLDAAGLAAAFERLGGPVSGTATADAFGFGATVLADHLLTATDLLVRVLREPAHAAATVAIEREVLQREAEQVRDDMMRYPFQLALGAAFNDQGYGIPVGGTAESLAGLTPEHVVEWLGAELGGPRGVLVVVGDVDPDQAVETLAERLHDWPAAAPAGPRPRAEVRGAAGQPRVVTLERQQTALAMVFPGPSRLESARHAAEVWAATASGLGGRLFDALRERRSLAYTVLANSWQRLGAGALLTYIATSPGREEEAREQMLIELGQFRRDGVTDDEHQRAVAYLAGQAEVERQTGSAVAADLVDAWLAGEPLEAFDDPARPYRAVTRDEVHAVIVDALAPERRAEGVVRGGGGGQGE